MEKLWVMSKSRNVSTTQGVPDATDVSKAPDTERNMLDATDVFKAPDAERNMLDATGSAATPALPQDHWLYNEIVDSFHIDRVVRDYNYTMDIRHIHEEYEIYYLIEGERYYFINQQTYLVTPGTLVFIDKEQVHRTGMASAGPHHDRIVLGILEEPFSSFLASFGGLQLQSFFTEQGSILTLPEEMRPYIQSLLQDIASELIEKKPGYLLSAMTKLVEFFIAVLRLQPSGPAVPTPAKHPNPKYQKVDEVAHYIVEHCTERISLEDLAGRFYINKFYLSRIFKEVTSFTINDYLNVNRIKKAHRLLLETNDSITSIAEQLGYENITYFERVFKKYRNMTPLKYRNYYRSETE